MELINPDALPQELEIIITKELIEASGAFMNGNACPIFHWFEERLQLSAEQPLEVKVSVECVYISSQSLHKYKFNPSFLKEDYDKVLATGEPYKIIATLLY